MAPRRAQAVAGSFQEFLDRLGSLKRAVVSGKRAPHKPLMLLYALARLKDGQTRISFREARGAVAPLLALYAPPVRTVVVGNPFLRLQNDGIWHVEGVPSATAGFLGDSSLARIDPQAGFDPRTLALLRQEPALIDAAARLLLDGNFPPSVHDDILTAVGLDLVTPPRAPGLREEATPRRRDPAFRTRVLDAYLQRCAICGFSLRHSNGLVGVDAAHIRWHAFDGPDLVANGIALCTLHHRLFDLGVLTVDLNHTVQVARGTHGDSAPAMIEALTGREIARPFAADERPAPEFLNWHRRQVFKAEPVRIDRD